MLSNFELHLLNVLLNEPLVAFKLRQKYTKAFSRMFSKVFSSSFGAEIEYSTRHLKQIYKYRFSSKINHIIDLMDTISSTRSLHCRHGNDGPYIAEISMAIFPQNIAHVYKILKLLRKHITVPPGGKVDKSSSLHIHLPVPNKGAVNKKIFTKGKQHVIEYIKPFFDSLKNYEDDPWSKHVHIIQDFWDFKVTWEAHCSEGRSSKPCGGCYATSFQKISNINTKEYCFYSERAQILRAMYLFRDGYQHAEKIFSYALELGDISIKDKLMLLFGEYNEEKFGEKLSKFIWYFIPFSYMGNNYWEDSRSDYIRFNSGFHTIETRLFSGTSDFYTLVRCVQLCNAMKILMLEHDPYYLFLFINSLRG